jgi:hypothetical protein
MATSRRPSSRSVWIRGLIGASGRSAVRHAGAPGSTLQVTLEAWRRPDAPLAAGPLKLRRSRLSRAALDACWKLVTPGSVRRFQIGRVEDGRATLLEIGPPVRDPLLVAEKQRLSRPVVVEDPVLGALTLDRRVNWFAGVRHLDGAHYDLRVDASGEPPVLTPRLLATARSAVRRLEKGLEAIRRSVAVKLHPLSVHWHQGDDPPPTRLELAGKLCLESAVVHEDGRVTLDFADGDTFAGHAVVAVVDSRGKVTSARIEG